MPEPQRQSDSGEGPLAEAALRLDQALDRLETALAQAPRAGAPDLASGLAPGLAPDLASAPAAELQAANDALAGELAASRRRGRKLKAAAAEASETVGRAIEEVRKALDEDAAAQGQLDLALESAAGTGDEPFTEDRPPPAEEEPTA